MSERHKESADNDAPNEQARPQKSVLLLGASGLTGGHCLRFLLEQPQVSRVLAPSRRALDLEHPKLQLELADPLTTLQDSAFNTDYVICCLGTTRKKAGSAEAFRRIDFDLPLQLARRAQAGGAARFALVSAVGAKPDALSLYSRTKGELEEAIKALGFEHLIIARPSLLLGERDETRYLEDLGQLTARPLGAVARLVYPKGAPIQARVLAHALVNALLAPDLPAQQILYYPELTRLAAQ